MAVARSQNPTELITRPNKGIGFLFAHGYAERGLNVMAKQIGVLDHWTSNPAVNMIMRPLALQLADCHVIVGIIMPSPVDARGIREIDPASWPERTRKRIESGQEKPAGRQRP